MTELRRLKIEGFRSIDRLDLCLSPLTVLIGSNGSGKSTILEALELLRRAAASPTEFMNEFQSVHGSLFNTLRRQASVLRFEVELGSEWGPITYGFSIREMGGGYPGIDEEQLTVAGELLFARVGSELQTDDAHRWLPQPSPGSLSLPKLEFQGAEAARALIGYLSGIDVQLPFQTTPAWAMRSAGLRPDMRAPEQIRRTLRLERFGVNLANAYHAMLTDDGPAEWAKTMEYVRLGLGDHIEDIRPRVHGDGFVALRFRLRGIDQDLNEVELSDGQLAYLGFVALFRLRRREMGRSERTLLAFDEPETHLHPATLARVVSLFEREALAHPVIVSTQSDALLDCLEAPAESVRVCELDERTLATRVSRLDAVELHSWLEDYRGVGALRSEGYLPQVVQR
jgi:predicted ATPase